MKEIYIKDNFITVGQILKLSNLFSSGGEVKHYILTEGVYINGKKEHRRGKKVFANDIVSLKTSESFIVKRSSPT